MNAWLKRCVFNLDLNRNQCVWTPNVIRKAIPEFGSQVRKISTSFSGLCYPRQAHVDGGGGEGPRAPAPLPKVPFCQGNLFYFIFFIFY